MYYLAMYYLLFMYYFDVIYCFCFVLDVANSPFQQIVNK